MTCKLPNVYAQRVSFRLLQLRTEPADGTSLHDSDSTRRFHTIRELTKKLKCDFKTFNCGCAKLKQATCPNNAVECNAVLVLGSQSSPDSGRAPDSKPPGKMTVEITYNIKTRLHQVEVVFVAFQFVNRNTFR